MLIITAGFFIAPNSSFALSLSKEEMIQNILKQIGLLQAQLAQLQNTPDASSEWCHTFNKNLKFGDKGKEVIALHQALEKWGAGNFDRGGDDLNAFEVFTEETASAVVGFQEKYKDEILTPNGLQHGTGFVGKATRAKLNQLYGCEKTYSSSSSFVSSVSSINLKYLSPSSGPVGTEVIITGTGFLGNNTIYFDGQKISVKPISIANSANEDKGIVFVVPSTIDSYIRCIQAPCPQPPSRVVTPGIYPVYVSNANGTSNTVNFLVTYKNSSSSSSSQSSITVLSPNGGETWTKGTTQTIKWQDNAPVPVFSCPVGAICIPPLPRNYDIKLVTYYPPCRPDQICLAFSPAPRLQTIAKNVSGVSYNWSVGKVINEYNSGETASDDSYTVQVCISGSDVCDSSNSYFKVVSVGSSSSSSSSSYTPYITSIDPASGEADGMTILTIKGSGFRPTASVFFSTSGMAAIRARSVSSDGTILEIIMPNDTATFTPGTYSLKVANNDGTPYSNSVSFTVTFSNPSINFYSFYSPNGSGIENLAMGQSYPLSWWSQKIMSDKLITISTFNSIKNERRNMIVNTVNDGKEQWVVPTSLNVGEKYYLKIEAGCDNYGKNCIASGQTSGMIRVIDNNLSAFIMSAEKLEADGTVKSIIDESSMSSNAIFFGQITGGKGPHKCYWDLGEGSGYDGGGTCYPDGSKYGIYSTMGNRYTKAGKYIVKFKATDSLGTTSESIPLIVNAVLGN